jgi:heme exporter protein CcmD
MSDHVFYIACSYGALALAVVVEVWLLRRHRRAAIDRAREADSGQMP